MDDVIITIVVIFILSGVITFVNEKTFGPGGSRVRDYLISPLTWPGDIVRMLNQGPLDWDHLDHIGSQILMVPAIFCLQASLFPESAGWLFRVTVLFFFNLILLAASILFPDPIGTWRRKRQAEARSRRAHAEP